MGNLGEALNIEDSAAGVRDCLAEETLCIWTELLLDALVVPVGVDEGTLDAELLHRNAEEVARTAVNSGSADEVVAGFADVENGVEVCCLTGACEHSCSAAFHSAELSCYIVIGRILKSCVEIT